MITIQGTSLADILYQIRILSSNKIDDLTEKVIKWGIDRNLYNESSTNYQISKLEEELTELDMACAACSFEGIKDGIGDMLVALIHIAKFNNLTITQCLEHAYNQINDRKGKMVNGLFVKE